MLTLETWSLYRNPVASMEGRQAGSVNRHSGRCHTHSQSVELAREFDRVTRRQDEEALADPDNTRTVDESVLAIPDMLGTLRDAAPAEHDLAHRAATARWDPATSYDNRTRSPSYPSIVMKVSMVIAIS